MTVPGSSDQSGASLSGGEKEPPRIHVRWVVIIAIAAAVGFIAGNPAAGIGAGFAVAVALHMMMS